MITVDDKTLQAALRGITFNAETMKKIEQAGAKKQIDGQRQRVPVVSGDTRDSIQSHIVSATPNQVVDEIGPESPYAPQIEQGDPNHPNRSMTPFIRPPAALDFPATAEAIQKAFGEEVKAQWPR